MRLQHPPQVTMGCLRVVGSLKWHVSFAEYRLFYRALLQKRPMILRGLLIVATPYKILKGLHCPHTWQHLTVLCPCRRDVLGRTSGRSTCTYTHTHTHTYTHTHIHRYTYTHIHLYAYTHIHTYTHILGEMFLGGNFRTMHSHMAVVTENMVAGTSAKVFIQVCVVAVRSVLLQCIATWCSVLQCV